MWYYQAMRGLQALPVHKHPLGFRGAGSVAKSFASAARCAALMASLLLSGCAIPQGRLSQRAWTQTATQEQQQQQLRADPQGDRDMLVY
jgi:hypothetical protein